jgi:nucleoside 2-deoxyribosyltransferase
MKPKVVLCGSYHRRPDFLRRIFRELETTGCRVLSPISLDFTDHSQPVVRTGTEYDLSINDLERFHLRALRDADFVWLHAPEGHVGISAAYELGYASALNKPVFSFISPADEMLATRVLVVRSVFEALEQLEDPG